MNVGELIEFLADVDPAANVYIDRTGQDGSWELDEVGVEDVLHRSGLNSPTEVVIQ